MALEPDLERRLDTLERDLALLTDALRYGSENVSRLADIQANLGKDHEGRLRSLERVAWGLAGVSGSATLLAIISFLVHGVRPV